ncbi:DUF7161 family protein [Mycobacterium numidiamassiliense]|uniref:DUF7161 family protein n=1 Tax=Mycobacterium numidiamassiliense TaxID=1841861 RepID=UPI003CCBA5D1
MPATGISVSFCDREVSKILCCTRSKTDIGGRGVVDVICLDETPNVMHDVRVHPEGLPEAAAQVEFRQLALYEQ